MRTDPNAPEGAVRPAASVVPGAPAIDAIWSRPTPSRRPLTLGYLVPHHAVTGGMKILLAHVRELRARGHRVRAVARSRGGAVMPPWTDVEVDEQVSLVRGDPLAPALRGCDAVVAGWYNELPQLAAAGVPALYFEQGHEALFGDVTDDPPAVAYAEEFARAMRLPVAIAAVSPFVAGILERRHRRIAGVVRNGIDLERYAQTRSAGRPQVLLVGNASLPFKGFDVALRAVERAQRAVPQLAVTWVSQVDASVRAPFPLELVVNPPQAELPARYAAAGVFLSASWYEGFALPPLEAMASGVPVVATHCGGILTYARDGENALLAAPGDVDGLAAQLVRILTDPPLAQRLAAAGRATAERFRWPLIVNELEDALLRVATSARDPA